MVRHSLVAMSLLLVLSMIEPQSAAATGQAFFPATGHTVSGRFLDYWQAAGGLTQFGFPLGQPFSERNTDTGVVYTVQYFERNRFEYHPENSPPYDVLLGRLGITSLQRRGTDWHTFPHGAPTPGCQFFTETAHSLCAPFLGYWQAHGGLPVFGLPLSEPHYETSPTDGKSYLVQHFERNRFEFHPENPAPYAVLLGLLGTELYGQQPPTFQIDPTLQRVVDLINAERAKVGVAPLHISNTLMQAAGSYSSIEAQFSTINHIGPDGSNPGQRLSRAGYSWRVYGENLAAGQAEPDQVVAGWMNSSDHRANILNANLHEIGIGESDRSNDPTRMAHYWALELGTA